MLALMERYVRESGLGSPLDRSKDSHGNNSSSEKDEWYRIARDE